MKVLHITPYPIFPFIGPCMRCLRQMRALKNQGMDVTLLCRKIKEKGEAQKLKGALFQGINILPDLPNFPSGVLRELGIFLFSWRRIDRVIDRIRPDIVHVHNPPDTLAFVVSVICSLKKIPLVYDMHDSSKEVIGAVDFNAFLKKFYIAAGLFFEREVIKRSTGIVTVSESLKKLLLNTRSVFRNYKPHFIVMRNVDESCKTLLERAAVAEEGYIFYSGTLYSKFIGIEFLIDAIEDLFRKSAIKLYVAGDGPYKKQLERYIMNKNLSDSVKLLGYIERSELVPWIEKSKLIVIPFKKSSHTEIALPNKIFEYMALGKPVVYPDLPGFREVLGIDNAGRYIPNDKEDLDKVIKRFLSDEKLRKSLGMKNRELAKDITFEKEFNKLLELYNKIGVQS